MNRIQLTACAGLLFLFACGTASRITHSWEAENITPKKYNKILVVALNQENQLEARHQMENHLVGDLKEAGYNAVSAITEYGPKEFTDGNEKAILDKLQNSNIDAVMTIVLLDKEKERYYVPGNIYYSPYAIYHRYFWGYYNTIYNRIYTPGYYVTNTRYFWESNLFDVASKELIYSAQTESFDPASVEKLAQEYGQLIVNDMVKKQVLTKQEGVAQVVPRVNLLRH